MDNQHDRVTDLRAVLLYITFLRAKAGEYDASAQLANIMASKLSRRCMVLGWMCRNLRGMPKGMKAVCLCLCYCFCHSDCLFQIVRHENGQSHVFLLVQLQVLKERGLGWEVRTGGAKTAMLLHARAQ